MELQTYNQTQYENNEMLLNLIYSNALEEQNEELLLNNVVLTLICFTFWCK